MPESESQSPESPVRQEKEWPSFLQEARRWIGRWDPVAHPEGPSDWFSAADSLPPFDPGGTAFDPVNAWWLAELCRIVYTPDAKEAPRPIYRDRPARHGFLEERTPFREILNLHKTANHVALYHLEDRPGQVLCFRGTTRVRQWLMNLTALPVSWDRLDSPARETASKVYVHQGFQLLFERLWPLVEPHLQPDRGPLVFTGHSLGGAFATMAAAASPVRPDLLVTFGSPRVGNPAFVDCLDGIPIHRIVNHHDIVSLVPALDPKLGERDFRHAGDLAFLGKLPGTFHAVSGPENPESPEWESPAPAQLLKASLGQKDPPDWAIDHAPANYAAKLRALAEG